MKKNLLSGILVAGLFSLGVNAQTWNIPNTNGGGTNPGFIGTTSSADLKLNTNGTTKMTISTNGKVGIGVGVLAPLTETFEVQDLTGSNINYLKVGNTYLGEISNGSASATVYDQLLFNYKVVPGGAGLLNKTGFAGGFTYYYNGGSSGGNGGSLMYATTKTSNTVGSTIGYNDFNFPFGISSEGIVGVNIHNNSLCNDATWKPYKLAVNGSVLMNSNVLIGSNVWPANATSTKLFVKGCIGAEEVRVSLTNWCDYVFEKNYQLKSLKEVDAYIQANKHLPEVPSEKEVVENGVAMGEMMKIHMKKIEELTLYMIELQKQNEKLAAEVAGLKK